LNGSQGLVLGAGVGVVAFSATYSTLGGNQMDIGLMHEAKVAVASTNNATPATLLNFREGFIS